MPCRSPQIRRSYPQARGALTLTLLALAFPAAAGASLPTAEQFESGTWSGTASGTQQVSIDNLDTPADEGSAAQLLHRGNLSARHTIGWGI